MLTLLYMITQVRRCVGVCLKGYTCGGGLQFAAVLLAEVAWFRVEWFNQQSNCSPANSTAAITQYSMVGYGWEEAYRCKQRPPLQATMPQEATPRKN